MVTAAGRNRTVVSGAALPIDTPVSQSMLLNKAASQSTSLYQQCSSLRSHLSRIHGFAPFFALASKPDSRQSTDPVTQLWDLFSLGIPLCFIFNLLESVNKITTIDTNPEEFDPSDERAKKRAIALFAMQIHQVAQCEPIIVTDLWDRNSTDGLVKVINTVITIVDRLPESAFEATPPSPVSYSMSQSSDSLTSEGISTLTPVNAKESARNNIVRELVETERKYVQDLEIMQKYSNALSQSNSMNQDTIHYLFPNLNKLLNFQRKFLIRLESIAELPWAEQRWGLIFVENEEEFVVYEPYCANYTNATDLMLTHEQSLVNFSHLINAKSELPAFLIKPVQRICKYPLLLDSLVKASSPADYPHYDELKSGSLAAKRITDKINEAQRRAENEATVKSLSQRIDDWKGHELSQFGELLLDDIFVVTKSEVDREYHVFLFEKIILCCKEALPPPPGSRRGAKNNSILKKQPTSALGGPIGGPGQSRKKTTPLLLKGRIFLNNVTRAVSSSPRASVASTTSLSHYELAVWWRGDDDLEFFTLRCRTEEQMKLWETNITRLIKEVAARRADRVTSKVASIPALHTAMPRLGSAYDRAWSTTESVYSNGQYNGRHRSSPPSSSDEYLEPSTTNGKGPAGYPGYEGFDVDDDDFEDYPTASTTYGSSGRGTPVGARRGTAPNISLEHDSLPSYERPRARTEDTNGHVMAQWRTNNVVPPTPATATLPGSALRPTTPATAALRPTTPHSLTSTGHPSDVNSSQGRTSRTGVRTQASATKLKTAYENGEIRSKGANGLQGQSRSRSVSQPTTYIPSKTQAPPLPNPTPWAHQANGPPSSVKRGSSSSQSTGESSDYSPNGSSPITPFGSSESSLGAVRPPRSQPYENPVPVPLIPPVKVKVHFHEDIFVIQVPRSTEYNELVERVGRKIRLCGPRRDDGPLRVKYKDEDGDMVSLGSTEDVQMAFEQYRPGGQVTLHVT